MLAELFKAGAFFRFFLMDKMDRVKALKPIAAFSFLPTVFQHKHKSEHVAFFQ